MPLAVFLLRIWRGETGSSNGKPGRRGLLSSSLETPCNPTSFLQSLSPVTELLRVVCLQMPDFGARVDADLPPSLIRGDGGQAEGYSAPQRRGFPVVIVRKCARSVIEGEESVRISLPLLPPPLEQIPRVVRGACRPDVTMAGRG